jgi:hypothetical protein
MKTEEEFSLIASKAKVNVYIEKLSREVEVYVICYGKKTMK